jgi:hypothetical protein
VTSQGHGLKPHALFFYLEDEVKKNLKPVVKEGGRGKRHSERGLNLEGRRGRDLALIKTPIKLISK